jgi:hypothetical protein
MALAVATMDAESDSDDGNTCHDTLNHFPYSDPSILKSNFYLNFCANHVIVICYVIVFVTVDMTDREKERRDKKRALVLKKKAKELAEAAYSEATAAAVTGGSISVK